MKKFFKRTIQFILVIIVVANILILVTGRTYLYKGIGSTYLVGKSGPTITDVDVFPVRTIPATNPAPWVAHQEYNQVALSDSSTARFERLQSAGFVVTQGGKLLHESYWKNYHEESVTNSFSVAKSIVSLLVGIAEQEGKLSLSDPVSKYLPAFEENDRSSITIKHLLCMSSGLEWDESKSPFSHNAEAYYTTALEEVVLGLEKKEAPGKVFEYASGNTQLLGLVLEKATGTSLSEYAATKLWQPLGAEHDAFWSLDDEDGIEKAFCCYYASGKDFARIGELVLNDGRWNGQQIINSSYLEAMRSYNGLPDAKNGEHQPKFGYSWWMDEYKGTSFYYARGIIGQYILVIPSLDMVAVRTGEKRLSVQENGHPADVYFWVEAALELNTNN